MPSAPSRDLVLIAADLLREAASYADADPRRTALTEAARALLAAPIVQTAPVVSVRRIAR